MGWKKEGTMETKEPEIQDELETPPTPPKPTSSKKSTPKKQTEKQKKRQDDFNAKKKECIDYCKKSNCDVIALQETKYCLLPEDVEDVGYTLKSFTTGKDWCECPSLGKSGKPSDRGLAFLVKSEILVSHAKQPHPRMAYLKIKFKDVDVMIMNLYAVTVDTGDGSKDDASAFFRYVTNFIAEKNFPGILILCGDLNAFPDQASLGLYEPFIGKHVYGSSNDHGKQLIEFLESAKLFHLNSRFEKHREQKWTRKGNTNQSNTEVDGFLCSRTDIVQDVDSLVDDKCPRDHRLIASLWSISYEYESRGEHSETIWDKYKTDLGELISSASLDKYNEFVETITSAAPKENRLMRVRIDHFTNKEIKEYLEEEKVGRVVDEDEDDEDDEEEEDEEEEEEEGEAEEEECDLSINASEVELEFKRMKQALIPGKDNVTVDMIKNGGPKMIKAATKLFNEILKSDRCAVPEAWKTVIFKATQTAIPQEDIKNIVFDESVCLFVHVFSNLLVGKCYKQLCSYVFRNEQLAFSDSSFETIRKNNDIEKLFTISMWLERYLRKEPVLYKEPVYLLFAKFKESEKVKVSSILKGLKKSRIHSKIRTAFSSLLIGVNFQFNNEPINFKKESGIHLGDVASSMLLGCVIRMLVDECFEKQVFKGIVWDDMIVFVGENVEELQSQAGKIRRPGQDHNLRLDTNSMIFMANQKFEGKLSIDGKTIPLTKHPNVTHRNWTLVVAEKVTGANKGIVKCKDGTKIDIQRRRRQIEEHISQEVISWKVSFMNESREEALQKVFCSKGTEGEKLAQPENSREEINTMMENFQQLAIAVQETSKWRAKAEKFFKESVIPKFFENCGVWNFNEFSSVRDACANFLKTLNIPNYPFNPWWYILTERARFLPSLQENNILLEMAEAKWTKELKEAFDGYKRILTEIDVMEAVHTQKIIWEQFVEYCEKRIYV
ncbi:unnamed protein product [Caenorhabditis nigoni]